MLFTVFSILALTVLDRLTKVAAEAALSGGGTVEIIPSILGLELLEGGNTGMAFGLFSGGAAVLSALTVALLFVGVYFVLFKRFNSGLSRAAVVLLVAGGAGNLYDRVVYGAVTDFIKFLFIDFPIFNLADCFVTVGAVLLVLSVILLGDRSFFAKPAAKADSQADSDGQGSDEK